MANRTTATEVKQIINTDLSDAIVESFITDANAVVTDLIGSSTELSDAQKASIEKYFTAHLIAMTREQQPQAEKAKDAGITYQGKTGMGLDATFYGQIVRQLDTTGTFAKAGKAAISINVIDSFDD